MWIKAMEIGEHVFFTTNDLPKKEDYGLTSQLRAVLVSFSKNIAEAFGLNENKDSAKFHEYSRGYAFETSSLLYYGLKVGYFINEVEKWIQKNKEIIHELNKLNSFLLRPHSQPQ